MADAATKTDDTPAPGGSDLMSDLNALTKDLATSKRQQIGEETQVVDQNLKTLEADRARMKSYLDRDGVGPDDVKKWDADAERQKYSTNPLESFGSLASVFGIMASAFTKAPMENALNASAAAMNATRARDDEAYKRAFEAFKTNMDLVIKRHQMQHEDYQDAVTLMGTDMRIGEAKLKQLASKYGDRQALLMLDHGMSTELFQMLDSRAKAMQSLMTANEQITKDTIQDQVFHSDPRSHSKNADEKYQAFIDSRRMDIKTSVDQQMFDRIWHSKEMSETPSEQKMARFNKQWGEYNQAKYHGTASDRMMIPVMNDVATEHPDWSPGKVVIEAQKRVSQAKAQQNIPSQEQLDQLGWNKDSIDAAAKTYNKIGIMPRVYGSRAFGAAVTGAIQNRATELMSEAGITPEQRAKNWQKFAAEKVAIQRFESGPQGNTIRSLGVVVDHLATLKHLSEALNNGNIERFNELAQRWAEETGSPVPTNFDAAKQIVGTEIIKSLGVAGAGTQAERAEAADAFARYRSPRQLLGAIDEVMRPLMVGQLRGLERQFTQSTGLGHDEFVQMLGPEAAKFLTPKANDTVKSEPVRRRQNGHVYEQQQDGSWKAVE